MRFRLGGREVLAEAGTTVLVPAGVPHTFGNSVVANPETRVEVGTDTIDVRARGRAEADHAGLRR